MGGNVFYFENLQDWDPPSLPLPKLTLVIGLAAIPSNLHPLINALQVTRYIHSFISRSVTRLDEHGNTTSQLCTETPSLENGRVLITDRPDGTQGMEVTFTLRPGLRWGDGSPLTTRDIVFSARVERLFHIIPHLAEVVAVDERTYKMILDAPQWDFDRLGRAPITSSIEEPILDSVTDPLDYVVKSSYNRAPETPGLWNGPYLPTRVKLNDTISLTLNPFWDDETPGFEQATLRQVADTSSLQSDLVTGEIDMAYGLTSDQAIDLRTRYAAAFDVDLQVGFRTVSLYLQTQQPPFDDKRVRQAIMLGIDREAIVAGLFNGLLPVATSYLPPDDPNYNRELAPWPYDPGRARALLLAAGYTPGPDGIMRHSTGERLTTEFIASAGNHSRELLIEVIRGQLRLVGVDVRTETRPLATVSGELLAKREFTGMVLNGWSDVSGRLLYETFSSEGIPSERNGYDGYNYTGYRNPFVDASLVKALIEPDPELRGSILKSLQSIIMDDLPIIPLYHGSDVLCSPKWMTGLIPARSTSYSSSWAEFWKPLN